MIATRMWGPSLIAILTGCGGSSGEPPADPQLLTSGVPIERLSCNFQAHKNQPHQSTMQLFVKFS